MRRIVVLLLIVGGVAGLALGISLWRAKPPVIVQVITYSPDMPAKSVEKLITNRIERWVKKSPGATKVESASQDEFSVVTVYFRHDTDPSSVLEIVHSLAMGALPFLPPNTMPPVTLPRNESDLNAVDDVLKRIAKSYSRAE